MRLPLCVFLGGLYLYQEGFSIVFGAYAIPMGGVELSVPTPDYHILRSISKC